MARRLVVVVVVVVVVALVVLPNRSPMMMTRSSSTTTTAVVAAFSSSPPSSSARHHPRPRQRTSSSQWSSSSSSSSSSRPHRRAAATDGGVTTTETRGGRRDDGYDECDDDGYDRPLFFAREEDSRGVVGYEYECDDDDDARRRRRERAGDNREDRDEDDDGGTTGSSFSSSSSESSSYSSYDDGISGVDARVLESILREGKLDPGDVGVARKLLDGPRRRDAGEADDVGSSSSDRGERAVVDDEVGRNNKREYSSKFVGVSFSLFFSPLRYPWRPIGYSSSFWFHLLHGPGMTGAASDRKRTRIGP
jgi:hypothetical protein